jgi:SAM-dependent methyltransferase
MKRRLLGALAELGLLVPSFRLYETVKAVRFARERPVSDDDLPLPPPALRIRVAGTADPGWFLESGRLTAETIRAALMRHGLDPVSARRVLDFGCGCGRVVRHFRGLTAVEIHGVDHDAALVRWCSANLPFATFRRDALEPPAPYGDESFDAVYAVSVLTHLPERLQLSWLSDIGRMLRPGGLAVVTVHGEKYVQQLTASESEAFRTGKVVVRWEVAAGTNLCTAFHPEAYVRGPLAGGFELLELRPNGAAGTPHQDLVVFRKPSGSTSDQRPSSRTGPAAPSSG